jgi:hypothetical protein
LEMRKGRGGGRVGLSGWIGWRVLRTSVLKLDYLEEGPLEYVAGHRVVV